VRCPPLARMPLARLVSSSGCRERRERGHGVVLSEALDRNRRRHLTGQRTSHRHEGLTSGASKFITAGTAARLRVVARRVSSRRSITTAVACHSLRTKRLARPVALPVMLSALPGRPVMTAKAAPQYLLCSLSQGRIWPDIRVVLVSAGGFSSRKTVCRCRSISRMARLVWPVAKVAGSCSGRPWRGRRSELLAVRNRSYWLPFGTIIPHTKCHRLLAACFQLMNM